KKLAEGIDGLVLDVKTGSGAFMQKQKDSIALAESLMNTAKAFNKKVISFITDMNQPLGNYIGNWFEVLESVEVLQGKKVPDLCELSFVLSGAMIYLGGKAASIDEGKEIAIELVKNGKAFNKFVEMVKLQSGDISVLTNPGKYPKSKYKHQIKSVKSGYFSEIDTYQLGLAALELGAGRETKEDIIDPKAGIIFYPKLGDKINKGDVIAELHTDRKNKLDSAIERIEKSVKLSKEKVRKEKLIKKIMK
ncbi:MAG: thymidine phosphorylase, partial [Ignavibacteriaceae bacterium]|nr:thymidine phosphorylase [Ignavibacteriaceae bacterium]